jgi:hypothetical protein|tara:strand:+ start:1209 stop:1484 length:276 start_codon:yes stop_codon:yes gene_type:complete
MKGGKKDMADDNAVNSKVMYMVVETSKRYSGVPRVDIFEGKTFENMQSAKLLSDALNKSRCPISDVDKDGFYEKQYSVSNMRAPERFWKKD